MSSESQLAELTAELPNPRVPAGSRPTKLQSRPDRIPLPSPYAIFEDWRRFERDLPFLVPYRTEPDRQLLLCLLLEHQSQADRLMPLRMLVNGSMLAPQWPIRFWDLADHTTENLLAASSPWLNALAVVRATNDEASRFHGVFAVAVERLAGLVARERMRWCDLMWMLISWALRRRPRQERASLVEVALEYQPDPNSQEEVQNMSTTLEQTLEEWAEQRGIERGIERGELAASRRLLCRWLEDRFGPVPDDLRRQIDEVKDLARLERSIRQCPSLRSLDELNL